MASKTLRPGMAPGIDAMLEDGFGVPTTPTIGRAEAVRRVRAKVEADGLQVQRIDVSELPVSRGALVDMAGRRVQFPEGTGYDTCYVLLVDPDAGAQWGHPAWWAFVPSDGSGEVVLQRTELPENARGTVRFLRVPRS